VHSVHVYEELKKRGVPTQLYLHQGGHGGEPPMKMMNRWFTRYLYEVENGVEDDPRSWVVREGVRHNEPTPYPDYPHPDAKPVALHAGSDGSAVGLLSTAAPPLPTSNSTQSVQTLVDDASVTGEMLAKAESSKNRLLFATAPLTAAVHISGTPRIHLRLACSKPAANLSVWLVALPWTESRDINDHLINRGWCDPQNRESLSKSEPLVPGQFYDVAFDLEPDDQIIPAGKRIGLMIFSSDHDFTLWPEPGTELKVDLGKTTLDLPVVGGGEKWAQATKKNL
jgi:X-Pro dipeptidyl-peptidase